MIYELVRSWTRNMSMCDTEIFPFSICLQIGCQHHILSTPEGIKGKCSENAPTPRLYLNLCHLLFLFHPPPPPLKKEVTEHNVSLSVLPIGVFNLLKPKTYIMYHQLYHSKILCSAQSAFTCFVWISEQTAIISLYSIN